MNSEEPPRIIGERPWFPGGDRAASFALVVGAVLLVYRTVRPLLGVILFALAISSLVHPLFRAITRWLGKQRLAAAVTVLGLYCGVFGPVLLLGFLVADRLVAEATELSGRWAGRWAASGRETSLAELTRHLGPLGPVADRALRRVGPAILDAAPGFAQRVAAFIGALGSAAAQIIVSLFLLGVATYYLLLAGLRWRERALRLLPLPPEDLRALFVRFHQVSVGVLIGSLGTALLQGMIGSFGYWIFGAPAPLIWGMLTAIASLIPIVGTALVWVPLAIVVAVSRGWWAGGFIAIWGAGVVGLADNLVRPLLTRQHVKIHPLFVFISIFGGLSSYGPEGILLGPLLIGLAITVFELYEQRRA